jgi:endoglucanase
MKLLLQKLAETAGPPGFENQVRSLIWSEIQPLVDELRLDNLGNLIARKGRRQQDGQRILLAAHMDETGLIVTHVDERGFARFASLGAVQKVSAPGNRVQFLNGSVGVIGSERLKEANSVPSLEQLFIDLGAKSRETCPVRVGDLAVIERSFLEMGNRLVGTALDDRAGVALLIEVLRNMSEHETSSPHELYFVFSAQEEVGSRGATVAAYEIEPDIGLAIDLTASGGTPKGLKMDVRLGEGPAIKVRDQLMLSDPRVVSWMVKTAEQARLPHQFEILEKGTNDARAIQLARSGVAVGGISIPARYLHTSSEMVDIDDLKSALRLLSLLLSKPVKFER